MISPELDTRVLAAGRTLGMSFSVMSILDDTRQVVRAGSPEWLGFTPRESSFCHHTIASPDGILVVEHATLDGRFASKSAVTRPGGLRFYAGACVHSPDGHRLGTLCVLDPQPGRFGAAERDLLKKMSGELGPLRAEHARDEADDLCTALARHGWIIIEARFQSGSLVLRGVKGGLIPSASGADLADMPVSEALGLRRNAALSELERCAGEASAWFGELEGRRPDGQPFWWEAQLLLSPGGRLRLVCRDVSERVLKLRQSRAAEALLAQVFFTSVAATAMIRVDGRIELVDPSFGRLVGQKPEELAGRPGLDVIAPEDRPLLAGARDRRFAHGEPFTIDLAMLHASGSTIPVRYHSEVTRKAGTAPLRVVTISPVAPAGSAPVGSAPAATPRIEVAGRIQLVGLDAVREALGDKWATHAERMHRSAEAVIRSHLDKGDSYVRNADGGFLICFGSCNEAEASLRACAIGNEIRRRLIGEGEKSELSEVSALTVKLPRSSDGAAPSAEALEQLFAKRMADIEREARAELATPSTRRTARSSPRDAKGSRSHSWAGSTSRRRHDWRAP